MLFSQLPDELILNIIYKARTYTSTDSQTLGSLSLISRKLNKLMRDNREAIIDYYTLIKKIMSVHNICSVASFTEIMIYLRLYGTVESRIGISMDYSIETVASLREYWLTEHRCGFHVAYFTETMTFLL